MLCSQCSSEVKPVVVFDIDGTLGDYHGHFVRFCDQYFGRVMDRGFDGGMEFHEWLELDLKDYRAAKLAYRQGGLKRSMDTYPSAYKAVSAARTAGCEIWIATTRPFSRLDNIDPDTIEWCRRNQIEFDGLLYGDDKYQQLSEHIDNERVISVIDDLPEQVDLAMQHYGRRAHLVPRAHNAHYRSVFTRAEVDIFLSYIELDTFTTSVGQWARQWRVEHA